MGLQMEDRQDLWSSVERSMFHFECQEHYGTESESLQAWLVDPRSVPSLRAAEPGFDGWLDMVAAHTARGVEVTRVRVQDRPMTDYQRFEAHFADENRAAGEVIYTVRRAVAKLIEPFHFPWRHDWWILDNETVMVQPFQEGRVTGAYLVNHRAEVASYRNAAQDLLRVAART